MRGWPLVGVWAVRAATGVLWLLVAAGPVAGVAAWASRPAPATVEPPAGPAVPPAGVAGWAELFVAAWLQAGEGDTGPLEALMGGPVRLDGQRPGGWHATRTAVVAAEPARGGVWAVTVAAELMGVADGVWQPVGVVFYRVGVAQAPGGALAATGLPAVVAAPPTARLETGMPRLASPAPVRDGPVGEALAGFFAALLAGDGDVTRYVSPDAGIAAVAPPPFTRVRVVRAGLRDRDDGALLVNVEVAAQAAGGGVQVLQYGLVVAQREGRWEVTELLPAVPARPTSNQ